MTNRVTRVATCTLGLALLLFVSAAAPADAQAEPAPARLSAVTVSTQPDFVTVFIRTSGPVKYETDLIESPDRVVIDLHDTTYAWRRSPLPVTAEPLRQVRGSQYRKDVARVVVELTRKVGYAIREDAEGLSIIIPTRVLAAEQSPTPTAPGPDAASTTDPAGAAQGTVAAEPRTPAPAPGVAAPAVMAPRVAQAAPAATAPATATAATQRLISLDFKEADVVNLLRILAAESGRNIVIGDDVKGKMSITLRNVAWELALDTILETRGLERVERDGVMRIVTVEQLAKERAARTQAEEARIKSETDIRAKIAEAELKEQEAQARKLAAELAAAEAAARGPLREETIRLSYADPEDVARTLQGILGLSADTTPVAATPIPGPGPIPAPPFSQLFGQPQPVPPPPGALISPTADVLAKGITIRAHRPTNSIFIRHYAADLERLKKLIAEKLDIPLPQVKIEARMEILDRADLFALGVQWGFGGVGTRRSATLVGRGFTTSQQPPAAGMAPSGVTPANPNLTLSEALPISATTGLPGINPDTLIQAGGNVVSLPIGAIGPLIGAATGTGVGGLSFGVIGSRFNVNLALEALRTEGKTRTLARPEVITVENNRATISLGEEIPYATVSSAGTQIQFKEALLKLEVVPTVVREADHNRIKMKVIVENNSRGVDVVDLGAAGSPPVINRRKAETEVLIKEGERLVIGGVTVSESADAVRKVPLFGDIPILGWLFKQSAERSQSRELVIFITPSVVPRDLPTASLTTGTAQRQ